MNEPDKASGIDIEIKESNAFRIYNRIIFLKDVFYIFDRNYSEFGKLLKAFNTPETILPFFDENKRNEMHLLINELIRHFHNYVTSAQTLVTHTRIMIRESYKNTEFINEYQTRIEKTFTNDPISVFVKDLRNYTLHHALPATFSQIQLSPNPQEITSRALLIKESLLHGYRWEPASKEYLAVAPSEIDLLELIDKHHEKFATFYDWLLNRLNDIHSVELEWLQKKNQEMWEILDHFYNKIKPGE